MGEIIKLGGKVLKGRARRRYIQHVKQMQYEDEKDRRKRGRKIAMAAFLAYVTLLALGGWHP